MLSLTRKPVNGDSYSVRSNNGGFGRMNDDGPQRLWAGLLPRLRLKRGREDECEVEEKSGSIGFGNSKANARARLPVSKMNHDWLSLCLLVLSGQT